MQNLLDKKIQLLNKIILSLIFLFSLGCSSKNSNTAWISSVSKNSGLYFELSNDTLNVYSFLIDNNDTNIIDFNKYPVINHNGKNLKIELPRSKTGSINYYQDSITFCHNTIYDVCYNLIELELKDAENFKNRIIKRQLTHPSTKRSL